MRDTITLQQRGIPAVALVTERFVSLAQHVARGQGMPNLPLIVLPPQVDFMTPSELQPVADKAFEEVVGKLTAPEPRKPAV
ncbi:MAG: hypothetical protein AAB502_09810 [Chloroflexota bacterium]